FVGKKCVHPPLGLITVAALLPRHWRPRVVDLNIEPLSDRRILDADVVMLTGMHVQSRSLHDVLARCRRLGVPTVVGGPYATSELCASILGVGRVPRTKTAEQVYTELDAIHATGFKGSVFFVDDNFIANKKAVRTMLPRIQQWQERHRSPFEFYTEASLIIAE